MKQINQIKTDVSKITVNGMLKRHPKVAKIEYPLPEGITGEMTYTIEEVFSKVKEKLNNHYGTNHKLKY